MSIKSNFLLCHFAVSVVYACSPARCCAQYTSFIYFYCLEQRRPAADVLAGLWTSDCYGQYDAAAASDGCHVAVETRQECLEGDSLPRYGCEERYLGCIGGCWSLEARRQRGVLRQDELEHGQQDQEPLLGVSRLSPSQASRLVTRIKQKVLGDVVCYLFLYIIVCLVYLLFTRVLLFVLFFTQ